MGTERDNAARRNTKKRGGVRVDEKRRKRKRERDRTRGVKSGTGEGTSEKTRRDGPAVIISDNHPEKLRGTSFFPHPLSCRRSSIRIRIKML